MSSPAQRWDQFASERPEMAEAGRALIYQFKVGLGYLATVRKDGGPRVHPVCPVIANGGLYVFVGNQTPKLHDLLRDGRYARRSLRAPLFSKPPSGRRVLRLGTSRSH